MNPRTAPAALTLLTAALAATACDPSNSSSSTAAGTTRSTAAPSAATPECTADFGPDGSGIHAFGGTVTGTVILDCTAPYSNTPAPLISLTLVRQASGSATAQTAGAKSYQDAEMTYTVSGDCTPATYALHILYGVTVAGHALADQTWGKQITLTADDCH